MAGRFPLGVRSGATLVVAAFALSLVGLVPASCTLDVQGTAPETSGPGSGGQGPGSGGSTSSNGGGGEGGTATPQELCLDGVDNDEDGLVDCQDMEDCAPADYECAPDPAGEWTLQFRAAAVPFGEALADCEAGTAVDLFASPSPAACTACQCTWDPTGAECTGPEVTCWASTTNCTGFAFVYPGLEGGGCRDLTSSLLPGTGSCRITGNGTAVNSGSCTYAPDGGALTVQEPWGEAVRLCAGTFGGGCDAGQVCVPRSTTGATELEGAVCVQKSGTDACPDGWADIDKQLYTTNTDDTRTCTPCACGQAGCAGGGVRAHVRADCDTDNDDVDLSMECSNLDNHFDNYTFSMSYMAATPTQPSCIESVPSGEVVTDGPVKLCCRQQP